MSSIQQVVHILHLPKGVNPDDVVYIGRAMPRYKLPRSKWANPFAIHKGSRSRELAIAAYEAFVRSRPELLAALPELDGKVLACWCAPEACHGDVLVRLRAEGIGAAGVTDPAGPLTYALFNPKAGQ